MFWDAPHFKTMKTDNKTRKDCALIVNRCSLREHWPHMQQPCLLMICSTLIFNRKQGQEMCIGLGMLGYILFAYIWTNQSRNPAAGWICFGPGLTNPGPSRTQTNFLVDNKQILSQQVAQLRVDRLWRLLKCCRKVKWKSTHKHNTLKDVCWSDIWCLRHQISELRSHKSESQHATLLFCSHKHHFHCSR